MAAPIWRGSRDMVELSPTLLVQRSVPCDVDVFEVERPKYALEFHATTRAQNATPFMRCVTTSDVAQCVKSRLSTRPQRAARDEAISADVKQADRAIQLWISKHKTPARQDIIVWLLERMVLVPCGETNQLRLALTHELGHITASGQNERGTSKPPDHTAPSDDEWDEDLPCYSAPAYDDSTVSDGDEDLPTFSPVKRMEVISQEFKDHHHHRRDSADHDEIDGHDDATSTRFQTFEPAKARISKAAVDDGKHPPASWADDSWRLVLELKKSKLDIKRAQDVQRKQDVVAAARKQRLLSAASKARTQTKIDKQTKKLVQEATRDAIEYHKVLDNVERQTKTKYIHHLREHEQTTRFLRAGQRQKWTKGAWLGPGPHPTTVYTTPSTDIPFVYDVHGRRHDLDRAADVASQSLFDAAMKKIQRVAAKAGKHLVAYFQRYDSDHSGTLTAIEFRAALADLHVDVSPDQMDELFACFDRNHSGAIDYGEFLWSFFNRRAFMKQWKATTTTTSVSALQQLFFKHDSRRRGALTARDFLVAMKELGFSLSAMDEALIVHKFDVNGDGLIDFEEFCAAFASSQTHDGEEQEKVPPRPAPHQAKTGKESSILSELDELAQVQRRIHCMLKH